MSQRTQRGQEDRTVSKDLFDSAKVQESGGSFRTTIPAETAAELGLDDGERVVFRAREGEDAITLVPARELY